MHLHTYSFISYIYTQIERLLCTLFKSLPLNFVYISYYLYCVSVGVCVCTCRSMHVDVRGQPFQVSFLSPLCRLQESYQTLWSGLEKKKHLHMMIYHLPTCHDFLLADKYCKQAVIRYKDTVWVFCL